RLSSNQQVPLFVGDAQPSYDPAKRTGAVPLACEQCKLAAILAADVGCSLWMPCCGKQRRNNGASLPSAFGAQSWQAMFFRKDMGVKVRDPQLALLGSCEGY